MTDPLDGSFGALSAEFQLLRFEAIETLEDCLTKGDGTAFLAFLEAQLLSSPPRLELLRSIADELHLRLLRLREQQLDTGQQLSAALLKQGVTPPSSLATQPTALERSQAQTSTALVGEFPPLSTTVRSLLNMAHQLATDIQIAEELYQTVMDWWMALSISVSRDLIGMQTLAGLSGDTARLQ
jgi:hypothetical protein